MNASKRVGQFLNYKNVFIGHGKRQEDERQIGIIWVEIPNVIFLSLLYPFSISVPAVCPNRERSGIGQSIFGPSLSPLSLPPAEFFFPSSHPPTALRPPIRRYLIFGSSDGNNSVEGKGEKAPGRNVGKRKKSLFSLSLGPFFRTLSSLLPSDRRARVARPRRRRRCRRRKDRRKKKRRIVTRKSLFLSFLPSLSPSLRKMKSRGIFSAERRSQVE